MTKKINILSITLIFLIGCSENISPVDSGLEQQIYHHGNGSEPQGIDPHIVTGVPEHHILISLCEGLTIPNPNSKVLTDIFLELQSHGVLAMMGRNIFLN